MLKNYLWKTVDVLLCDDEFVVVDDAKEMKITIDNKTSFQSINNSNYFTQEWHNYMEIRTSTP